MSYCLDKDDLKLEDTCSCKSGFRWDCEITKNCPKCNGEGLELTFFGKDILEMVKKYLDVKEKGAV